MSKLMTSAKLKTRRQHFARCLDYMEHQICENPETIHQYLPIELSDKSQHVMTLACLYMNMVMWYPNVIFRVPISKEDIYLFDKITASVYESNMNRMISKFTGLGYKLDQYNIVGRMKSEHIRISRFYGEIVCNTYNLYDIMALESRNTEFSKIFNNRVINNDMGTNELNKFLDKSFTEMANIIIDDKRNSIYPYLSTEFLNKTQLGQNFVGVGSRKDLDKTILPINICRGFVHGLQDIAEFFAEAVETRNGITVKETAVPTSGYLSAKVGLACTKYTLNKRIFDCGTRHYLEYFVENEKYFESVVGKYMLIDTNGPKLKEITNEDRHIIGKRIKIRSHSKCVSGHSIAEVCCVCLGKRHHHIDGKMLGGLVGIQLVNPLTKKSMSYKHVANAKTDDINCDAIGDYMTFAKLRLFPRHVPAASLLVPYEKFADLLNIGSDNNDDEDEDESKTGGTSTDLSEAMTTVLIKNNDTGVLHGINLTDSNCIIETTDAFGDLLERNRKRVIKPGNLDYTTIFINGVQQTELPEDYCDDLCEIPLSTSDVAEAIFEIKPISDEITRHLKLFIKTIDGAKTDTFGSVEEFISAIQKIILDAGLSIKDKLIHMETMALALAREYNEKANILGLERKPDYSQSVEPRVRIYKLSKSIKSSDLFTGFQFERMKEQLDQVQTVYKQTKGAYDTFFQNDVFDETAAEFRVTRPYLFQNQTV